MDSDSEGDTGSEDNDIVEYDSSNVITRIIYNGA